jgi:hypothetical protein
VDPRNASSLSAESPPSDTRAISPLVTPRSLRCLSTLFRVFRELVGFGSRGWLRFLLVARTLRIISRLRDYDAISVARSRNERYKTTVLGATTNAFDARGELDGQLLSTFARRCLANMSQYEDK